jgi:flagellar protein FlgJ
MTPVSAPLLAAGSLTQSHGSDRARLSAAAKQFEAIFLRQLLAAARKADFGEDLISGKGLDTFRTMQDEHFAGLAAETGSFGLAAQIEAQLAAHTGMKAP